MKMKRFLTMMFLMLFTFTMLPAGKIMATVTTPTGTLTITNDSGDIRSNSEYSAYKIISFDLSMDASNKYVYTNLVLDTNYRTAIIASVDGLPDKPTDYQIFDAISKLTGEKIDKLAYALKGAATDTTATALKGVFTNLTYGYYLVIETANGSGDGTVISKPILVSIPNSDDGNANLSVKVKTSKATIEKKIVKDNNLYDTSTAAVGDKINYRTVSTIPTYPSDAENITYYITDTFSAGLSFNSDITAKLVDESGNDVQVLNQGINNDYTVDSSTAGTFRLTLNNTANIKNWGNSRYKMIVTYSATLGGDTTLGHVSYGSIGNPNSVRLTYSNKPNSDNIYSTPDDTVITYATRLVIVKTDGGSNLPLPGVTFELKKGSVGTDGTTITWNKVEEDKITDQEGKAYFTKLEQGSYMLTETHAPTGYVLLKDPILFTISAKNGAESIPDTNILVNQSGNENAKSFLAAWHSDNDKITINNDGLSSDIKNTKGFTLPGTGGIGTTIFTVVGISIILLGCSMIIIYMKKTRHPSNAK